MIQLLQTIYFVSGVIIAVIVVLILTQKRYLKRLKKTEPEVRAFLFDRLQTGLNRKQLFSKKRVFKSLQAISDEIVLTDKDRVLLYNELFTKQDIVKLRKQANSIFILKRLKALNHLSYVPQEKDTFIKLMNKEKNPIVYFYSFYLALPMMNDAIFKHFMKKIIGFRTEIVKRFSTIIANHYEIFKPYLKDYLDPTIIEHVRIQIQTAMKQPLYVLPETFGYQLKSEIFNEDKYSRNIVKMFLAYLNSINDIFLLSKEVLNNKHLYIRSFGYQALAKKKEWPAVKELFGYISDDYEENQLIASLISGIADKSTIFNKLIYYRERLTSENKRSVLAQILSEHAETFILNLDSKTTENAKGNLGFIIEYDFYAGIIAFINRNRNKEIEDLLFKQIDFKSYRENQIHKDLFIYIKPEILKSHDIEPLSDKVETKGKHPTELSKIIWLTFAFILAIGLYPMWSILSNLDVIGRLTFIEIIQMIVVDTNRNLIYYFLLANFIYLLLMIVSLRGSRKQNLLWDLKSKQLLYEDGLLPNISIIAPAYNEEVNIITSVRSLLNLKYPEYEVIVVNDGSKDNTLKVLIEYFNLKRGSPFVNENLKTKSIRGIYRNSEYPNLIVVNKTNGGKADALNVGINVSNYDYICGIDADSVLNQDALLRVMSSALDHKHRAVALGGNIVPANGCRIDFGQVEEKHFPKENVARFQAVEYIRSFSSGRIGWSELNSLLIISGAFGVFYKDDIIKIGGYITSSGALKKDSVGEDMELVVRLTYERMKLHKKHYIGYVYHGNCYTELPSDMHTLLKQRNRWHRGLLDILSYHHIMIMNPRYKHIGVFVLPYFYIFEVLGPFFEWIGYLSLLIAMFFGFLTPVLVILIYGVSIVLGVIISLLSLLIQESRTDYMSRKDMVYLMIYSILESFGYRQFLSLHRVYSFFTALFETGKWGEQKRKGI